MPDVLASEIVDGILRDLNGPQISINDKAQVIFEVALVLREKGMLAARTDAFQRITEIATNSADG